MYIYIHYTGEICFQNSKTASYPINMVSWIYWKLFNLIKKIIIKLLKRKINWMIIVVGYINNNTVCKLKIKWKNELNKYKRKEINIINNHTHCKFWTMSLYWSGICRDLLRELSDKKFNWIILIFNVFMIPCW